MIFLRKKSFILKKYKTPSPHIKTHSRWRYKKVGLLGGTFNPPHVGHLHVANAALKKYKFHAIWWLVSPQNPLKKRSDNFKKRLFMTRSYISHPKMVATDIESLMNVSYSLQTIQNLKKRFSRTQFHWLAGMDNAKNFHHWQGWKKIISLIPFTFFNRPPNGMALQRNPIKMYQGKKNISFCMTGKTLKISSTQIRQEGFARAFKSAI